MLQASDSLEPAKAMFECALVHRPRDVYSLNSLALILQHQGSVAEAQMLLVRALALAPDLILLDEPLAGLNQAEATQMADRIASLVTATRSIILIEHNLREVIRICPKLFVQDHGGNLDFGPTQQVMANPKVRAAYLGEGAV